MNERTPGAAERALLVIVDVQNDFCGDGALGVDGGRAVARAIRQHVEQDPTAYAAIAISQDWHRGDDDNGGHFSPTPDFQDSWPVHCVAGTPGAELQEEIRELAEDLARGGGPRLLRVRKGYGLPAYSALEGSVVTGDDADASGAPFADVIAEGGFDRADVVGLALDFCVAASARDLAATGVPTRILRDLTAAVHPEGADALCARLESDGITITTARGADHG